MSVAACNSIMKSYIAVHDEADAKFGEEPSQIKLSVSQDSHVDRPLVSRIRDEGGQIIGCLSKGQPNPAYS
jgi:hypothetical protein